MESARATIYQPLSGPRTEIRLLEILEQSDNDQISCLLHTVSLSDDPSFAALSYVWGDPAVTETISINNRTINCTTNLAAALRSVKSHWQKRFPEKDPAEFRLWADAVCINQEDFEEKSVQVRIMGLIYSSAEIVFSWLGCNDDKLSLAIDTLVTLRRAFDSDRSLDVDEATLDPYLEWLRDYTGLYDDEATPQQHLEWLRDYTDLCDEDDDGEEPFKNKRWEALCCLLELPYWKRIWIFQEIVLARQALLVCRSAAIDFCEVHRVAYLMDRLQHASVTGSMEHRLTRPDFISSGAWRAVSDSWRMSWTALQRINIIQEALLGRLVKADCLPSPEELYEIRIMFLIKFAAAMEATDPKDKVYATLGLTGLDVTPDYRESTPVYVSYSDYIRAWLGSSQTGDRKFSISCRLMFLFQAGVGFDDYPLEYPTWIPKYSEVCSTRAAVGGSADRAIRPDTVSCHVDISGTALMVSGTAIQTIRRVVDFPKEGENGWVSGRILLRFLWDYVSRHANYVTDTDMTPLDAFTRVFSKGSSTKPANPIYTLEDTVSILSFAYEFIRRQDGRDTLDNLDDMQQLLGYNESHSSKGVSLSEWAVIHSIPGSILELNDIQAKFEEFVDSNLRKNACRPERLFKVWNKVASLALHRRFFETQDGYLGQCPIRSMHGDLVCVLYGCNSPVVLRPVEGHYLYVGECAVLGLMEGQASSLIEAGRSKMEVFEIR